MDFLTDMALYVFGFMLGMMIFRFFFGKSEAKLEKVEPSSNRVCPLHKWEYLKNAEGEEYDMVCMNCKKTPSQILNEHSLGR